VLDDGETVMENIMVGVAAVQADLDVRPRRICLSRHRHAFLTLASCVILQPMTWQEISTTPVPRHIIETLHNYPCYI